MRFILPLLLVAVTPFALAQDGERTPLDLAQSIYRHSGEAQQRAAMFDRVVTMERQRAAAGGRGMIRGGDVRPLTPAAEKALKEGKAKLLAREAEVWTKGLALRMPGEQLKAVEAFYASDLGKAYVAGKRKAGALLYDKGARPAPKASNRAAIQRLLQLEGRTRQLDQLVLIYGGLFTDQQIAGAAKFLQTPEAKAFQAADKALELEIRKATSRERMTWFGTVLRPLLPKKQ